MKNRNRTAAIILSLIMIVTLIPSAAFAGESTGSLSEPELSGQAEQTDKAEEQITDSVLNEEVSEDIPGSDNEDTGDTDSPESAEQVIIDQENVSTEQEENEGGVSDYSENYEENTECEDEESEDIDESGEGYGELSFEEGISVDNPDGADPDALMEDFFKKEDEETDENKPLTPYSVKGDRLTGNSLRFYNYFKSIIKKVAAAKTSAAVMNSTKTVKLQSIIGRRTFTAKQLGVKQIGYKKNGRWYITKAANKKLVELITASDWNKSWKNIYTSLLSDLSSESYWVDWYGRHNFIIFNCPYTFNKNSITFNKNDSITFRVPVMQEYRPSSADEFKASTAKIKTALSARSNARSIVDYVDSQLKNADMTSEEKDINRMYNYCYAIAKLNTYNTAAALSNPGDYSKGGPWSMISVFDGDSSTNAVCSGYARAFKLLCDLSSFESDWIDCQIVSGYADGSDIGHMWNIVRMYDGLNYVVDPTWMDIDSSGEIDLQWFLRGSVYGDANSFIVECEKDGQYSYSHREYDEWTKASFAPAERRISSLSEYYLGRGERLITLKKPVIKKPKRGKKSFTARWKKVGTALGALYVDGYQIQYSRKKNMKGAKTLTVKGYAKTSAVVKKLKKKKIYYVRVRSYAKAGKKTYYSAWSAKKKVKTR